MSLSLGSSAARSKAWARVSCPAGFPHRHRARLPAPMSRNCDSGCFIVVECIYSVFRAQTFVQLQCADNCIEPAVACFSYRAVYDTTAPSLIANLGREALALSADYGCMKRHRRQVVRALPAADRTRCWLARVCREISIAAADFIFARLRATLRRLVAVLDRRDRILPWWQCDLQKCIHGRHTVPHINKTCSHKCMRGARGEERDWIGS